jgi:hypothetical protein
MVVTMTGALPTSASYDLSGASGPVIEETIGTGNTVTVPGLTVPASNLQFLYLVSTTADAVVTFVSGNGNSTISLTAGTPYIWPINTQSNPVQYDSTSVTIQNNGTQNTSTDIHGRLVFSN